jgi:hypothetical protein
MIWHLGWLVCGGIIGAAVVGFLAVAHDAKRAAA